jgi:isochorismate hydrolase
MRDIREEVYTWLHHLSSLDDLRDLFIDTLNYSYTNVPGPLSSLPGSLQEHVRDLRVIANYNGFSIFYAHLDSLSRSLERAILQKLWKPDFCGLFVFSDAEQRVWEFVNAIVFRRKRYNECGETSQREGG